MMRAQRTLYIPQDGDGTLTYTKHISTLTATNETQAQTATGTKSQPGRCENKRLKQSDNAAKRMDDDSAKDGDAFPQILHVQTGTKETVINQSSLDRDLSDQKMLAGSVFCRSQYEYHQNVNWEWTQGRLVCFSVNKMPSSSPIPRQMPQRHTVPFTILKTATGAPIHSIGRDKDSLFLLRLFSPDTVAYAHTRGGAQGNICFAWGPKNWPLWPAYSPEINDNTFWSYGGEAWTMYVWFYYNWFHHGEADVLPRTMKTVKANGQTNSDRVTHHTIIATK